MDTEPILAAARRGFGHLCSVGEDPHWTGFPTLAGRSDAWVTAFIVAHLRTLDGANPRLREARDRLLEWQRDDGGWGYGPGVPSDADSTSWALTALKRSRRPGASEARQRGLEFLAGHRVDSGFATYRRNSGIAGYIGAGAKTSIEGWTSPHPDVTAAALLAGHPTGAEAREVLGRLIARQRGTGWIESYWWRGNHYATALTLRALRERRYRLPEDRRGLLLRSYRRQRLDSGGYSLGIAQEPDPFTTALALEGLCHLAPAGGEEERRAAGRALLASQRSDGGWNGGFTMRLPAPGVVDPDDVAEWERGGRGGNSYIRDEDGLFATATSVRSLTLWATVESEGALGDESDWSVVEPAIPSGNRVEIVSNPDGSG